MISTSIEDFRPHLLVREGVRPLQKPFKMEDFGKEKLELKYTQSETKDLAPGEVLIQEGPPGTEMYLFLADKFELAKSSPRVRKTIFEHINAKELIEKISFFNYLQKSTSVEAMDPTKVLLIPNSKFANAIKQRLG